MKKIDLAISTWQKAMSADSPRPWAKRLATGDLQLCHYKGFLLETYHNTQKNPQLQAFATMYFKEISYGITKKFFLHASSEVSHDSLAFSDLVNLGVKPEFIKSSVPLPTTRSLFAVALQSLMFDNPVRYLGYLFHLEYTPLVNGENVVNLIKSLGAPDNTITFLDEHIHVDPAHVKMLSDYMEELVKTDEDIKALKEGINDFVALHNRMLEGAFENGEKIFST